MRGKLNKITAIGAAGVIFFCSNRRDEIYLFISNRSVGPMFRSKMDKLLGPPLSKMEVKCRISAAEGGPYTGVSTVYTFIITGTVGIKANCMRTLVKT